MTTRIVTEYSTLSFFGSPFTRLLVVGRDRAGGMTPEQINKAPR